jgi:hypothetical protein
MAYFQFDKSLSTSDALEWRLRYFEVTYARGRIGNLT